MSTAAVPLTPARGSVLADVVAGSRARDIALVIAGALFTALGAQIAFHVPPSPVPITGQTLAVVVAAATLGARRGAASQGLYLVLGLFLPVYSDGGSGLEVIWGATGGYIVGFIVAAYIIGTLAERGADRRLPIAFATFVLGQLVIFGIGVPWLKVATGMDWAAAIHGGFTVFIVGGLVKAALSAAMLPGAWRLVRHVSDR